MSNKEKIIEYILSKGWVMTQGEFATKGAQRIEFDCEPYLISYHGNSYEFETLIELNKIISFKILPQMFNEFEESFNEAKETLNKLTQDIKDI